MRLTKKLERAILWYYFNRNRQGTVKWNKDADFQAIADAADASGYSTASVAGTFFFTKWAKNKRYTYITSEETFPNFRKEVKTF